MKKKFEFDYFLKNNNNKKFEFPNNNKQVFDKWSKLEKNLQKNRDNYYSNDAFSTLNLGSLKSMEWDDDTQYNSIHKNNINFDSTLNKNRNKNTDLDFNLKNLEKLIHPIDDEFEQFIQNKIENLEKLKYNNNKIIENNNIINITNNNIKNNIKNNSIKYNNILLSYGGDGEKSIIKEKNEAIFTFNRNDMDNNEEFGRLKTKSFLADYNDNAINTSIFNTNKKYENSVGNRNKIRLNRLLNRIKNDKKETELINKPNKFKLFDTSDENSNLDKIQRRYYEQFREEDKHKDNNDYTKDYFSTILYELNQGK